MSGSERVETENPDIASGIRATNDEARFPSPAHSTARERISTTRGWQAICYLLPWTAGRFSRCAFACSSWYHDAAVGVRSDCDAPVVAIGCSLAPVFASNKAAPAQTAQAMMAALSMRTSQAF